MRDDLLRLRFCVIPALIAALVATLSLSIGYGLVWPLNVDIGGQDARFALSFNAPEITADARTRFRWSDGDSIIALPRPPGTIPSVLRLRLLNGRPGGYPPPDVHLSIDGHTLTSFNISGDVFRTYRLLLPPAERLDRAVQIGLVSDAIVPEADPRPLGVVVDAVTLAPTEASFAWPSAWVLACGLAIGMLGYALPRLAGLSRHTALAASMAASALIAFGVAGRPLEVLPFLQRFVALPAIGCTGLVITRILAPIKLEATHSGPPRPVLDGAHLPIIMAVAWWMLPLFQLAMIADDATGVGLAPQTIWIGTTLIAALVSTLIGWRLARGRALPAAERRNGAARVALIVLAVAAAAHLSYNLWYAYTRQAPDFWILFRGAREWTRGGSMYDIEAVLTNHFGHVFKVPPFYGMLFVPFVTMDGMAVLLGHRIMNTVLILATAFLWLRMWRLPILSLSAAALLIVFNFRPLADTLAFGQIDLMLLFLLTMALWALRSRHEGVAGALVALGTLFKIYPVLLLAFFVLKGQWRALAGFTLAMALYNGLSIAIIGWNEHLIYLTQVVPHIGGTTSWVENQTISGFLARLTDSPREADIYQYQPLRLLGIALSGSIALTACALALRPAPRESTGYALQYGTFLLLMVLAAPAAWMHYQTLLIIPFGALLLHLRERMVSLPHATVLATSFALIAYGNQWSFYDGTIHGVLTIAGVSYKFYGMLLLGGLLAAETLREPAPAILPRLARMIARPGQ